MKLVLPSSGVLGFKTVDFREPTFGDIRAMRDYQTNDALFKSQFVKRLLSDSCNLRKITKWDMEYMYVVATFALQYNNVTVNTTCPFCGAPIKTPFSLNDKELVMFDKKHYPFKKKYNGVQYTFNLLSMQDEIDCIDYALAQEEFEPSYRDAVVCATFGHSVEDSKFLEVLPPLVYYTALLFQKSMFHGVVMTDTVKCPAKTCGKEFTVVFEATQYLVNMNMDEMLASFASVSDRLSFEAFLSLTLPEFDSFLDSLNEQLNG